MLLLVAPASHVYWADISVGDKLAYICALVTVFSGVKAQFKHEWGQSDFLINIIKNTLTL